VTSSATSQGPSKALSPTWGQSVGGVSGRVGAKAGGSNPFAKPIPSRVVTGKSIPIFWKAVLFAGHCRNEGLGRSIEQVTASPVASRRADDSGCSKGAEEGNVVSLRAIKSAKRRHPAHAREIVTCAWGHVLHSVLRPVHVNPHYAALGRKLHGWWGGREGITVGQTWATRRNQHWGVHERTERGSPLVTATARSAAWQVRKGRRSRPSSLRGSRGARVWLPARRNVSCRSR